jgi:hypothetical protein
VGGQVEHVNDAPVVVSIHDLRSARCRRGYAEGLRGEQLRLVAERRELQRVARRIAQEHRPLLTGLTGEPQCPTVPEPGATCVTSWWPCRFQSTQCSAERPSGSPSTPP